MDELRNKELVSIIVPVYKVEQFLYRCVESILAQSYKWIEIILVDDGTPDTSSISCDDFANHYSHIRVIHKGNGGLTSARLAGFRYAQGEYVLFIDSDDYIHPQMVEKLVKSIQKHNADLSISAYQQVNTFGSQSRLLPYNAECLDYRASVEKDYILPLIGHSESGINIPGFLCIRLLKRNLIQESFFGSERVYYKEDHVFDLLYADNIKKIAIVNEPLYFYCFNSASLSNCYREDKWGMYCNLYKFYDEYLRERNLSDSDRRLDSFLVSAFSACIDNAVLTGSFHSYRSELMSIMSSSVMRYVWLASQKIALTNTARLSLLLCRGHAFRVLYHVRKSRLNRNVIEK